MSHKNEAVFSISRSPSGWVRAAWPGPGWMQVAPGDTAPTGDATNPDDRLIAAAINTGLPSGQYTRATLTAALGIGGDA